MEHKTLNRQIHYDHYPPAARWLRMMVAVAGPGDEWRMDARPSGRKQSIFWCRSNVRVNKIKSGARTLTSNNAKGADARATSPGPSGRSRNFTVYWGTLSNFIMMANDECCLRWCSEECSDFVTYSPHPGTGQRRDVDYFLCIMRSWV